MHTFQLVTFRRTMGAICRKSITPVPIGILYCFSTKIRSKNGIRTDIVKMNNQYRKNEETKNNEAFRIYIY